jgi:hypothetical protein
LKDKTAVGGKAGSKNEDALKPKTPKLNPNVNQKGSKGRRIIINVFMILRSE